MNIKSLFYKIALISALILCFVALCSCSDESVTGLEFTSNKDGTCYVSGIGDCTEENIVIPSKSPKGDKVTAIGDRAFFDCFTVKTISIPDSVTYIGDNAFRGCIYLTEIDIPASVTHIGETILTDCKALEIINVSSKNTKYISQYNCLIEKETKTLLAGTNNSKIPTEFDLVTSIAPYAFFDLDKLQSVDLGNKITKIGDHAFESCGALKTVEGTDALVSIGDYAFDSCAALKNIDFTNNKSLTEIGKYAFHACDGLSSFVFPTSLKTVGDGAFWSCNSLKKAITFDISAWAQIDFGSASATPLNYGELVIDKEVAKNVTIQNGTKKIGDYAFYNCGSLSEVTLPDSVESIGAFAFSDCGSATNIKLGKGVKSIGEYAFRNCKALTDIKIPAATQSIGDYAFLSCGSVASITVSAENAKYKSTDNCLIEKSTKTLIKGCSTSVIPSDGSVEKIANYAFKNCAGMVDISIPANIKHIGLGAFEGCTSLTNANFADDSGWKAYQSDSQDDITSIASVSASSLISTYVKYYWVKK